METIAAIATPIIKSALGIIRVSGDDSFNIVQKIFDHDLINHKSRRILIGKIIVKKIHKIIDEVVVLQYVSPKSYTGENMIEIISHGSILVLNDILAALIENGARIATKGEFSMRAVLNKKMTLNKAEVINDLINCTSNKGLDILRKSFDENNDFNLIEIKNDLENLIANIEVNFDYPEYKDIEVVTKTKIVKTADKICQKINLLIGKSKINNKMVFGVKVAIIGKTNVGKSTLLNCLCGKERSITSSTPGTTRDIVSEEVTLNGVRFMFYDTAGIRLSKNSIEKKGISLAKKILKDMDLILYVFDKDREIALSKDLEIYKNKILYVKNKCDLLKNKQKNNEKSSDNLCLISAKNKDIKNLIKSIFKKLDLDNTGYVDSLLYNDRQIGILKGIFENLTELKDNCLNLTMDLIATTFNECYRKMLDLLGLTFDEELSKNIFKNFCVGK